MLWSENGSPPPKKKKKHLKDVSFSSQVTCHSLIPNAPFLSSIFSPQFCIPSTLVLTIFAVTFPLIHFLHVFFFSQRCGPGSGRIRNYLHVKIRFGFVIKVLIWIRIQDQFCFQLTVADHYNSTALK
jgi:hypothetical protein